ncbi:ribonuclease Y [Candidatus Epulonipiscium viviparus]|uniref:ribonuclease Y n=1 Tax=Candidatus Epulonipiscium viviparus TaxID=420336 RepID=UPI0004952519|nr:ribonuclease Y [Candidatus Epulopiscium viviparus]
MEIIIPILNLGLGLIIGIISGFIYRKYILEKQLGIINTTIDAGKAQADQIIAAAIKQGESDRREMLLIAKEDCIQLKDAAELDAKMRRAELSQLELKLLSKEETIDRKVLQLEDKESQVDNKLTIIEQTKLKIEKLELQKTQELEQIAGISAVDAKATLLKSLENEIRRESAILIKDIEAQTKLESTKKARDILTLAIQKCAADHVVDSTVTVVTLPNDEMKGRIIGREGRNIRTLETLTGINLIIDDTPEAVVLSGFDPIRREIARIALEKLIMDGRIHPTRIEEMVEKARKEIEVIILEEGEAATFETGVHGIHHELMRLLGKMKFRTSYGQNVLRHSIEVSILSGLIAAELGFDVRLAKRAGLLHDIGKAIDYEQQEEGSHITIGVDLCRKYGENDTVINAVESHHGDVEPTSMISVIVQTADTISAARPGARRETLETYIKRLNKLEEIANSFEGVESSFAIQAGREIRIVVIPDQVDDQALSVLARDVTQQIEKDLEYPGQIKVNIIRETRAIEYAK